MIPGYKFGKLVSGQQISAQLRNRQDFNLYLPITTYGAFVKLQFLNSCVEYLVLKYLTGYRNFHKSPK